MEEVKSPILVVDAIIERDEKIVLIERKIEPFKGMLAFPGGHVKYEETIEDATKREVKEETNLDVVVQGLLGVGSIVRPDGVHELVLVYKCKKKRGKIKLSFEHSEYIWTTLGMLKSIENLATSVISILDKLKEELAE